MFFGQVFWDGSENERQYMQDADPIEMVYSNEVESVIVHAVPRQVLQRYAGLSDEDITRIATRWVRPNGSIRLPRSADFYTPLMQEIARLARIAVREHKALLIRTQFRGPLP